MYSAGPKTCSARKPTSRFGELRVICRNTNREIGRENLTVPEDFRLALERVLSKNRSAKDVVAYVVPSPSTVNQIPTAAQERKIISSEIEKYFMEDLSFKLSATDCDFFRQNGLNVPDEAARRRVHLAIDEVIFEAAVEHGPTIFLVPTILQRVADWVFDDGNGGQRHERLGSCLNLHGQVTRGEVNAPLAPWWVRSRGALLRELKDLRKQMQAEIAGRQTLLNNRVLLDAAVDLMEGRAERFPKLTRIGVGFQLFVDAEPEAFRQLIAGDLTVGLFTDQLVGWITNRDPESARQRISELSSQCRPGRK